MINQSVFAFANVEDYLALSEILLRDKDNPTAFFARAKLTDADGHPTPAAQEEGPQGPLQTFRPAQGRDDDGNVAHHTASA